MTSCTRLQPRELVGRFMLRAGDGTVGASGPLRFSSGSASSDDAGPLFGRAASTWSAAVAPAGDWTVEIDVPELRLATAAAVSLAADGRVDLRLAPPKRGSIAGYVLLPSSPTAGALVSVDARASSATAPAASAGAYVFVASAAYGLYGLDAGTYTVTAGAAGFVAASSTVYVSTGADVSLELALSSGATLSVAVTVLGDSTALGATFDAEVSARPAGRLEVLRGRLRLGASPTSSSGTFTFAGLSSGPWVAAASLAGYGLAPSSGALATVTTTGAAALTLTALDARLRLEVVVPPLAGGACRSTQSYRSLGLLLEPASGPARFYAELPALAPTFAAPRTQRDAATGAFALLHCASATVFTPALPPGAVRVWAGFLDNGARASGGATLTAGATAALSLDVSVATVAVSGRVSVSGEFALSTRAAGGAPANVIVSSAGGLNAWSPGPGPVLLGSSLTLGLRGFRAELRPLDAAGRVSTAAALMAPIRDDGGFVFPGVSAGAWRLRVPGELDGDLADGDEAAPFEAALQVGTAPVTVAATLGNGAAVSGRLVAPGGTRLTANLRVTLTGEEGEASRTAEAAFADGDSASFVFNAVPPGRRRLLVEDPRRPAAWTAAPRALETGAAGASGLDLRLEPAGSILGRLALARARPDGTQERVLLTRESVELLPAGLRLVATAVAPGAGSWAADPELDAEGRFLVAGLPAGTYALTATAAGALAPVTVGGVAVAATANPWIEGGFVVAAASVSGRPVQADGYFRVGPLLPARATSRIGASTRTVSDAAGYWRLDGLDPAERWYDVTAAPRGEETAADAPAPYAPRRLLGVAVSTMSAGPSPWRRRPRSGSCGA